MPPYTLKWMARGAYIMGLNTIGEMANHMLSHHYAYFHTAQLAQEEHDFLEIVRGHEDDTVDMHLTEDERQQIDAELSEIAR